MKFTPLKGTGIRGYKWLKVVFFDRTWLGESLADNHNVFNGACNFILN
jgi:hypothetical protein